MQLRLERHRLPTLIPGLLARGAALTVVALGLALGSPAPLGAAEDDGTVSVLAQGAGNRALALGGAFTAVADDASGWMWNPGGLGLVSRAELQTSQGGSGDFDTREYFAGFVMPSWRWGAVAFSYRQFGVTGIDARDDRNTLLADNLSDRESEAAFGYGRSFRDGLSLGGVVKMRGQQLAGRSANAAGADLGLTVRPGSLLGLPPWTQSLALGLAVQNVVQPVLRLDAEEVPDPRSTRIGLAYQRPMLLGLPLLAAVDLERTQGRSLRTHAGIQVKVHPMMDLRFGMNGVGTTAGAGFRYGNLAVDYAFEDHPVAPEHHLVGSPGTELEFAL